MPRRQVIFSLLIGYIFGAGSGAVWVGSSESILWAIVLAPLGMIMAIDPSIWGNAAGLAFLAALALFAILAIAARVSRRPQLFVFGSFLLSGVFAFLGGATAVMIATV